MSTPVIVTRIGNPSRLGARAIYAKSPGAGGKSQKVATLLDQDVQLLAIEPGTVWTAALAARAEHSSFLFLARRDAHRTVAKRAVTRQRLIDGLRRKGHLPEIATAIADELTAAGLLNDRALAESFATAASAKAGKRRVEAKLRARGIDRQTAARAASAAGDQRDALADATALAAARARRMSASLTPDARQRRLFGFLARRGYDGDICRRAIAAVLKGARSGPNKE